MKKLTIEQLKEGFILTDENDDKYAVPVSMLSIRVKAYFGLTKFKPKKEKTNIAPPAKVSEATKPETQGSKTPDSHSGGAIDNHKVERKRSARQEDPDRMYRPMLKKDTRGTHGEDYEKIEGTLET